MAHQLTPAQFDMLRRFDHCLWMLPADQRATPVFAASRLSGQPATLVVLERLGYVERVGEFRQYGYIDTLWRRTDAGGAAVQEVTG